MGHLRSAASMADTIMIPTMRTLMTLCEVNDPSSAGLVKLYQAQVAQSSSGYPSPIQAYKPPSTNSDQICVGS
jgi:hypothetical protein